MMEQQLENFETWLRIWTAENLGSPGESTDPEDVWVQLRADELIQDATHAGFYGELVEAVKPYGGAEGYVGSKLQDVRANACEGDGEEMFDQKSECSGSNTGRGWYVLSTGTAEDGDSGGPSSRLPWWSASLNRHLLALSLSVVSL